ncbi:helix-turn-helix domain-containing protein [Algoriphagus sp.]|uniref:helix-turn-helix domain-containing protein n=1 Tax=Algoriphagus sp. TaxID=1872435 RepID=UPI002726D4A6|nr:helix-turn-helix transcriptional regulator [Algoriphagus sp.]MDO8965737.1 helix-turn-helix transcriptional regulator [Algoriphagus sp.]MDP3198832.1 helix-turn-helix transcriptional regulator [Algoriphagus sp.]
MEKPQKIMRILRESKEYSQEYVANVLNINQKTYSSIESGKSKLTVERINQLADLYHVKPDYFLSEELPVINYNTGPNSHGGNFKTYNNNSSETDFLKSVYEKMLQEKNQTISNLENQIEKLTTIIQELTKVK